MNATGFSDRLAVCTWSLQPTSPADLVEKLKPIGIPRVQLALDPIREHLRISTYLQFGPELAVEL